MRAVVVGAVDFGEADRIIRLLAPDEGRCAVMARRARSAKNRFGGAFDLGNVVEIEPSRRGRGGLPTVSSVDVVQAPRHARADLDRIALLAYGAELCAALAPEHHPAPKLFQLLVVWLECLEAEVGPGSGARVALEAKALTFAGLAPALLTCARCGRAVDDPMVFDPESGGALHQRCGGGRAITRSVLVWIEALRRTPLAEVGADVFDSSVAWLLSDFARHQLGRNLKSRALLEQLQLP